VVNASEASAGLPHPDAGLRNLQVLDQADGSGHLLRMLHLQHALRPALRGWRSLRCRCRGGSHHPRFQPLIFFAQHACLTLLKADSAAAVATGQLHGGQQLSVTLEKSGVG
jgi:hypothetical protein